MKKKVWTSVLCLLAVLLTGCGSTEPYEDENENTQESSSVQIPVSEENFAVREYLYENDLASMYFVIIENQADAAVSISGHGIARDADNNMLGEGDISIDVLGPGETSIGYFYFSDAHSVDHVEYTLSYDANVQYLPVLAALETEQAVSDKKVTVQAVNTGTTCAEFVEAHALFFDADGRVINYTNQDLADADNEIKPGRSMSVQLDSYLEFDHAEVYLKGRSSGETAESTDAAVSDADFSVTTYLHDNSFSTMYFVIITNESTVPVGVTGNASAKDADGNIIGADDMSIDILGSGETSIGYFYFNDVQNVADVDYELQYDTVPYYTPAVKYLLVEQTVNDTNVTVTVTNENTVPAESVEAHALFFDEQNTVLYHTSQYIMDADNEIKPGDFLAAQLDAYEEFDHVEVYFTGKASGGAD